MIYSTTTKDGKKRWHARRGGRGKHCTFDTKREAQGWEDSGRLDRQRIRAGIEGDPGPIVFGDLVKLWEANFQPGAWRKKMLQPSLDRWGHVFVREIRPQGLGTWLHQLEGPKVGPLSEKTKSHVLETLRQVLNTGVEWGYLSKSPARPGAFKAPSAKRIRPIRPFASWDEVERVAELCSPTGSAFVRFCCATGVRVRSEAVDLMWTQINLKEKELRVEGTKTVNAPRTIPLSRPALEALNDLPRRLSGRVFGGKRRDRFDYHGFRKTEWKEALALAGLEHRPPYEMRHTFATLALEAGAALEDISPILGHSGIEITHRYYVKWTRPRADRLRGVLDTIGKETGEDAESAEG